MSAAWPIADALPTDVPPNFTTSRCDMEMKGYIGFLELTMSGLRVRRAEL